jgi:O-antigen ligase
MPKLIKFNLALCLQSLVLILSPLYILRFKLFVPGSDLFIPTTFLEILLFITISVTFFEFAKDGLHWNELKTKFEILILGFAVAAFFAVFASADFIGGLGILKAYFIEPILFFYSLVFTSRKYGYSYIVRSLIVSGFWISALAAVQKITGSFSLAPYELIQGRVPALYNSANSLALYLCPIALITLGLATGEKTRRKKILYFLVLLFFILIVVWTRSRGGMVALVFGMIIFVYALLALKNTILQKIWYLIPLTCLSLVAVFFYLFYLNYNFLPQGDGRPYTQGDTLQIRYFIWVGTINMLRDHPVLGAGLDGFKTLYANEYRLPQFQEEFQYPHNLILTFWTEMGIFGLFAFLLLITESISLIIRNIVKSKNPVFGASLIAIISYILIHGIVDVPYFKNDLSVEFWTILALIQIWQEKV